MYYETYRAVLFIMGLLFLTAWAGIAGVDESKTGKTIKVQSSPSDVPMSPERSLRIREYCEAMLGTWYNTATNDVRENEKQHLPFIESVTFSSNSHVQITYISSNQVHTFSGKYKSQFLGQTAGIFIISTNATPVPIQSLKGQIPFLQEDGEPCLEFVSPQSTPRNILTKRPLRK